MPRPHCEGCGFLSAECLCDVIERLSPDQRSLQGQWLVLQHPKEVDHPKNTLRLLQLSLPALPVAVGETADDFESVLRGLPEQSVLLYPSSTAPLLNDEPPPQDACCVLIDATWRKAKKIMALNPRLQTMPHRSLPQPASRHYRRRKTSVNNGLSTLEAFALARELLEQQSAQPLLALLDERMHIMSRYLERS